MVPTIFFPAGSRNCAIAKSYSAVCDAEDLSHSPLHRPLAESLRAVPTFKAPPQTQLCGSRNCPIAKRYSPVCDLEDLSHPLYTDRTLSACERNTGWCARDTSLSSITTNICKANLIYNTTLGEVRICNVSSIPNPHAACICTHIPTCMHTYKHACYVHACLHPTMHTCAHTYMQPQRFISYVCISYFELFIQGVFFQEGPRVFSTKTSGPLLRGSRSVIFVYSHLRSEYVSIDYIYIHIYIYIHTCIYI